MAGFRLGGRKPSAASMPPGKTGGDASRFAAANLPPCKASPPGQESASQGIGQPSGADAETLTARAAAAHFDAMYGADVRHTRRLSPLLIMSIVFAVGAGAGLAGAKWFASTSKTPPLSPPAVALNAPVTTTVDPDGQARALRGIRASELPYDGRAPEQADEPAPQVAKAYPPPVSKAEPPPAVVPETPPPELSASKPPAQEAKPPVLKEPKQAAIRPTPKTEAKQAPVREARRAEAAASKPVRSAKAERDRASDKEVERMRRQADDELGNKTASAASAARRSSSEPPSKVQQVSSALASCEQRPNIILREHCRWQICNGKWGKNGCPSYASARRDQFAY